MAIKVNESIYGGSNIVIQNGKIIIDGRDVTPDGKTINIVVDGNIEKLQVDACDKIYVNGNVTDLKTVSGDVILNEVEGDVMTTSGDVDCHGDIGGSIKTTSGDVEANQVGGSITTVSGDIKHRK